MSEDSDDADSEETAVAVEICGTDYVSKEGVCQNAPKYEDGKCGLHSDHTEGPGPPKGSSNNPDGPLKHGVYADPSKYYQRLSESDQAFVDGMYASFLDDAPFDSSNHGKCEMLRQIAIDIHKRRSANNYIAEEGLKWEEIDDYYETDDGDLKVITETDEHYLNITADRIARTNVRQLKELGVLDDPQSQQADAQKTFLEMLSSETVTNTAGD